MHAAPRVRRRIAVAGLAVTTLLSVLAVTADAGGTGRAHWRVIALPAGPSFSEPGIVTGRHGTVLVNACTANAGGPAAFWRSTDDGRHWSRPFRVAASPVGCGDADTAIGDDGYEYALLLGSGVNVYRSADGRHWAGPAAFPPPHGEDQPDRPWLVTVPGRPDVVHVFNSEIGGNVVEWTSTDHAATFTGPVPVTGGLNSQAALTIASRPLVDPRRPSRMRLFYETASFAGIPSSVGAGGLRQFPFSQLWQARTDDGGRTWSNRLVLDLPTAFHRSTGTLGHLLPATAVDRAGTVYVVLSVQLGTDPGTHLFLLHSTRSGGWSRPVGVDHAGASNVYPAVAVRRPGHVFVSWYGAAAASFTDDTARWHELVATTRNALSARPTLTTTVLGRTPVHVGAIGQAGAVGSRLGQDWTLRDFQSIVVDRCGHPHVAWAADSPDGGRTFTATTATDCR